jgi:alpha-D-ribose 1-methylphosphonate 5-triphosphate synthase subunit PhnG
MRNEMTEEEPRPDGKNAARRRWMGVLARAKRHELEYAWSQIAQQPTYEWLRQPEVGLVMVQARAGGTGDAFNMTEMSMTRCALRLADGTTGYAYVQGRDIRQAELAAIFDALLQHPDHRPAVGEVIDRLEAGQVERRREKSLKAASTKVEFFTMVRAGSKK